MKQIFKKLAFFAVVLGMPSCFNLDEEVFDRVDDFIEVNIGFTTKKEEN